MTPGSQVGTTSSDAAKPVTSTSFPKYLMKIDGQRKFLSLSEAGRAYDSGFTKVDFGRYILNADFTVRPMEESDRVNISEAADKHSESK